MSPDYFDFGLGLMDIIREASSEAKLRAKGRNHMANAWKDLSSNQSIKNSFLKASEKLDMTEETKLGSFEEAR